MTLKPLFRFAVKSSSGVFACPGCKCWWRVPCSMSYRNTVMDKTRPACSLQWTNRAKGDGEKKIWEGRNSLISLKKFLQMWDYFPVNQTEKKVGTAKMHKPHSLLSGRTVIPSFIMCLWDHSQQHVPDRQTVKIQDKYFFSHRAAEKLVYYVSIK